MKQKAVIKVSMNDQKCRKKALKIVVGCEGVESAAIEGKDKDQIAVIGDGIDAVKITTSLRKNVGDSDLVSVSAVGEKEGGNGKKNDPKPKEPNPPVVWTSHPYTYYYPYTYNGEKEGGKQEGDGKKNDPKPKEPNPPVVWTSYPYTYNGMPHQYVYEVRDPNSDPCAIM